MSRKYNANFDPIEFQELYTDMERSLAGIHGQEVVAFIGMSGAGKSTTLSYLLGCDMEKVIDQETGDVSFRVSDESQKRGAEIGHGASSATVFPGAHRADDFPKTLLLDTAGLKDTRGKNVKLCASFALPHISKVAKVKGVVIVLRQADVSAQADPRGQKLRDLLGSLKELTSEFDPKKIAFCVTGITSDPSCDDNRVKGFIKAGVAKLVTAIKEEAKEDSAQKEAAETERLSQCFTDDNIFIMRGLDNPDKQKEFRKAFFAYAKNMVGLADGLQFAMDEVASLQLAQYCERQTRVSCPTLSRASELRVKMDELQESSVLASELREKVENILMRKQRHETQMIRLDGEYRELSQQKKELEKDEVKNKEVRSSVTRIRIPVPARGVATEMNFQGVVDADPRVIRVEPGKHVEFLEEKSDLSSGHVCYAVSYQPTGHESEKYVNTQIVTVHAYENTETYRENLSRVNLQLRRIEADKLQLERSYRTASQEDRLAVSEVQRQLVALGDNVNFSSSDLSQIRDSLVSFISVTEHRLRSNHEEWQRSSQSLAGSKATDDFVYLILKRSGFWKKDGDEDRKILAEFVVAYEAFYGVAPEFKNEDAAAARRAPHQARPARQQSGFFEVPVHQAPAAASSEPKAVVPVQLTQEQDEIRQQNLRTVLSLLQRDIPNPSKIDEGHYATLVAAIEKKCFREGRFLQADENDLALVVKEVVEYYSSNSIELRIAVAQEVQALRAALASVKPQRGALDDDDDGDDVVVLPPGAGQRSPARSPDSMFGNLYHVDPQSVVNAAAGVQYRAPSPT